MPEEGISLAINVGIISDLLSGVSRAWASDDLHVRHAWRLGLVYGGHCLLTDLQRWSEHTTSLPFTLPPRVLEHLLHVLHSYTFLVLRNHWNAVRNSVNDVSGYNIPLKNSDTISEEG